MSPQPEPSAFDWLTFAVGALTSLATLAAVVVAIVLGFHEVRKFRTEEARPRAGTARPGRLSRPSASPSPVYDVMVHDHTAADLSVGVRTAGMIPPGETACVHLPAERC